MQPDGDIRERRYDTVLFRDILNSDDLMHSVTGAGGHHIAQGPRFCEDDGWRAGDSCGRHFRLDSPVRSSLPRLCGSGVSWSSLTDPCTLAPVI